MERGLTPKIEDDLITAELSRAAHLSAENTRLQRALDAEREKVKALEEAYQRMKNNELLCRNMWLTTYRSLIAQQKGCVRLRRRLNKLLGKPATREGREG